MQAEELSPLKMRAEEMGAGHILNAKLKLPKSGEESQEQYSASVQGKMIPWELQREEGSRLVGGFLNPEF